MNSTFEARTIFRELGAGEVSASLATQWAHHKPITSRPEQVPSIETIRLIQKGLVSLGCPVKVSGKLDPHTAQCLEDLSGPSWKDMTWLEHGKKIIRNRQMGVRLQSSVTAMSGLGSTGGGMGGSLGALIGIGALVYIMVKTK